MNLIKTNGGVLLLGADADIGAGEELGGGEGGAHGAGESNNDHDGVGGGIAHPFLAEALLGGSMGVLQGSAAHEAAVGDTVDGQHWCEKKSGIFF